MTTKQKGKARSNAAEDADTQTDGADAPRAGRLIKYMGASHVRVLEKGETFGGQLPNGLPQRVEWNLSNNHIINSDDVEMPAAAIDLLLEIEGDQFDSGQWEDPDDEGYAEPSEENTIRTINEFVDVTDAERVAPSLAQQIFLGMSKHQTSDDAIRAMESGVQPENPAAGAMVSPGGTALVSGSAENAESSETAPAGSGDEGPTASATAPTTTVGGSTDGATGAGGGGPVTTVGGSTDGVGGNT